MSFSVEEDTLANVLKPHNTRPFVRVVRCLEIRAERPVSQRRD